MTLALTLIALVALALLVWAAVESRRNARQDTWICTGCLQGFSSHEDALRHIAAVHPRVAGGAR